MKKINFLKKKKSNISTNNEEIESKIDKNEKKSKKNKKQNEEVNLLTSTTSFPNDDKTKSIKERILSVDRFRGLCMFLMALSIFVPMFGSTLFKGEFGTFLGSLFEHAPRNGANNGSFIVLPGITIPGVNEGVEIAGVSLADLFAPMFVFAIGLTIVGSFKSREAKYGTFRAYLQLSIRFLAIMGLGLVINGFEDGWADVFFSKVDFNSFNIQIKIFAASFWIFIILLIPQFISFFLKTNKFYIKTIFANANKWFLAIIGLIGLYFIMVKTGESFTPPKDPATPLYGGWVWDTLQNIGLAGLYALPFIALNKWVRLFVVLFILAVMTVLYQNGLFNFARKILEGGVVGGIMWACILLFGTIYYDLRNEKSYWVICSLLLVIPVFGVVGLKLYAAKRGATPMYALFSASVAALIWGILNQFNNFKPKYDFLADWGANAIMTYLLLKMLSFVIGGLWEKQIETMIIGGAIPIILLIIGSFTAGNWLLRWKNIHIRI